MNCRGVHLIEIKVSLYQLLLLLDGLEMMAFVCLWVPFHFWHMPMILFNVGKLFQRAI